MNKALKVGALVGGLVSLVFFIGLYFSTPANDYGFFGTAARGYALLWAAIYVGIGSLGALILTLPFWNKHWGALWAVRGFCIGTLSGSVVAFSFIWLFLRP